MLLICKEFFGGSWDGIHNWSWTFTVPENIFSENETRSITTVWELWIDNDRGNVSTSNAMIEVIYEDEETQDVQANYTAPTYTVDAKKEFILKYTFKNKPIKTIKFKGFGYDNDWGASYATLKAILY